MLLYKEENLNFKNKKTTDCVIRAISKAEGKDYKEVAQGLFDCFIKTGYAMNDKKCYEKYLEQLGWQKKKQPRKRDNTKYLVGEANLIGFDRIMILSCAHHLTCKVGNAIVDIWDCRRKTIGNYWIKNNKNEGE